MTFKRSAFPSASGHGGSGWQQLACGRGPTQWALAQPSRPAASCCRPDTESAACHQRTTHSTHRAVHTQGRSPPGLSSPKPRGPAGLLSHGVRVPQLCSGFKAWDSALPLSCRSVPFFIKSDDTEPMISGDAGLRMQGAGAFLQIQAPGPHLSPAPVPGE